MSVGFIAMPLVAITILALLWSVLDINVVITKKASTQWKLVLIVRVCALIAGVAYAFYLANTGNSRLLMIAPGMVGIFVILGVLIGEVIIKSPAPSGARTASLVPRSIAQYWEPKTIRRIIILLLLHGVTLVITTLTAGADGMGRSGRALYYESGGSESWSTPYPGSYYTLWQVVLLVTLAVLSVIALHVVVQRPRGYAHEQATEDDMRRISVATILAAFGVSISLSHLGIAGIAGMSLISSASDKYINEHQEVFFAPKWFLPLGVALICSVVFALVIGVMLAISIFSAPKAVKVVEPVA